MDPDVNRLGPGGLEDRLRLRDVGPVIGTGSIQLQRALNAVTADTFLSSRGRAVGFGVQRQPDALEMHHRGLRRGAARGHGVTHPARASASSDTSTGRRKSPKRADWPRECSRH